MKTKKEIQIHLIKNGYSSEAITKIMGFLIGKGIKKVDESVITRTGKSTFEDFYEWYQHTEKEKQKSIKEINEELINKILNNEKDIARSHFFFCKIFEHLNTKNE